MTEEAPRTFRRESRLFLWVALLLILLLNFVMLLFFRSAVDWSSRITERRAGEILRRIALAEGEPLEALDRLAVEPDILFLAAYDERGRRVRSKDPVLEAPLQLPLRPPALGRQVSEWRERPALLLSAIAAPHRIFAVALDPGPGASLRSYARTLSVIIPIAGAALVVLAWFYLRSLLQPYDRLLAAAGAAPGRRRQKTPTSARSSLPGSRRRSRRSRRRSGSSNGSLWRKRAAPTTWRRPPARCPAIFRRGSCRSTPAERWWS